ncbi:erythromycin esterase family protein [Streptomyces sp. NPDC101733]|uniref:erythromycin esterase family protein n=1 Tax=unclassified Streptomyces TaxID=2593676 RepID=UPI0038153DDC
MGDGTAHTAATDRILGLTPDQGPRPTTGALLRQRYGAGYVSVAVGFHHGDLGVTVPAPAPDRLDARLGARIGGADPSVRLLDLRRPSVRRRSDGPAKVRVISGIHDPSRDAAEHIAVASLAAAFDVFLHVRRVTPVRRLP